MTLLGFSSLVSHGAGVLSAKTGDPGIATSDVSAGNDPATTPRGHPESYCHRCGGPNVVWHAPSPLWNEVMRGGDIYGFGKWGEIICPTCFVVLAAEAGIATRFRVDAMDVQVPLQTTTPSGRVWDESVDLWVDPA